MTRNDIQEKALKICLPYTRCSLCLTMRTGKTKLALTHMSKSMVGRSPKFLVVAPKKSIFKSWVEDAKKFELAYLLEYITFSTYLSLKKQDLDYDGIYLDEVHSLLPSHETWLDAYKGKILGLTGTSPKYGLSDKAMLIEKYCPSVYEYLIDDAVEDGIINDYQIIVHTIPLSSEKTYQKKTKDGRFWILLN